MIQNGEKQELITSEKLETENVWHFCLKNDFNGELIIKMVGDSFSMNGLMNFKHWSYLLGVLKTTIDLIVVTAQYCCLGIWTEKCPLNGHRVHYYVITPNYVYKYRFGEC